MDEEVLESLLQTTKEMVEAFSEAGEIRDVGFLLMQMEVELGRIDVQDAPGQKLSPEYVAALDEAWSVLSATAVERALELGFDPGTTDLEQIERDLYDNYFHAAVAGVVVAHQNEAVKQLPLLAWAAFNKHSYEGFKDEIALLRMLLWAGYDPNAQDEHGMTALHYMASMKVPPNAHRRAVRLLLQAGADPNIQNERGDSALCYLSGNSGWNAALHFTAIDLIQAGADPLLPANDGATALSLLQQEDPAERHPNKQQLIDALNKMHAGK